jgi:hypothetical protein
MFSRVLIATIAGLSAGSAAVAADWLSVYNKDEFDGKDRYFAITSAVEPNFGFVCDAEKARVRVLYKTGKKLNRKLRSLSRWAKLAAIVDDQPAASFPGRLAEIDSKLVFESDDASIVAFGKQISGANRRVLVAIDTAGEKQFRMEFPVKGSGAAIARLLDTCAKIKTRG